MPIHPILNKNYKRDPVTGTIKIEEKVDPLFRTPDNYWVTYSHEEIKILNGGIDKQINKIRNLFGGEIVEYTKPDDLKMKGMR